MRKTGNHPPWRFVTPRRFVAVFGLIGFFFALCSCVDLGKVNEFAKATQDIGTGFKSIAQEGPASCERARSYLLPDEAAPDCAFYARVGPSLVKINDALFAYIAGLGKLASADASKIADGLKDVPAQLKEAEPGVSQSVQDQARAATDLATALAKVLTSGYRLHALERIIAEVNGDLEHPGSIKQVTTFLSEYAAEKYEQALEAERILEARYCVDSTINYGQSEPLALTLLQRKCSADEARILEKKNAIRGYREALAAIAAGHQKLYDSRNAWSEKQLIAALSPEIIELVDAASSMKKAF